MAKETIFFNDKILVLQLKNGVQFAWAKMEENAGGASWLAGMWICEEVHFEMVSATLLPSKLVWPLMQAKIIVRLVF